MKQVIVAGAGIVGVSAALWLQRAGHRVTLVDREGPAAGTSHGNAGILAAGAIIPVTVPGLLRKAPGMLFDPDQPLFLRWSYLPRLLPFLRRYLAHGTPAHLTHFARNMTYLLGDSLEQHQSLAHGTPAARYVHASDYCFGYATEAAHKADAKYWAIRAGNGHRFTAMSGAEYRRRDPFYQNQFGVVVACKDHGRISDPGAYVQALADHFVAEGGALLRTTINDIDMDGGTCRALMTSHGRLEADHIVLALGPWSAESARKMGVPRLSMESERGYHIELVSPSQKPLNPMMVNAGKFVITPMEGRIRCAGVVEFGGLKAGPSRAPFDMMRRYIRNLLGHITWQDEVEWMGHRPAPSDSLPLIGPVDRAGRGYAAFGHQHVGLTGGPKTGRIIADMISGVPSNADLTAFSPARMG